MKMLFKSPLRAVDGDDVAAAPSEPMVAPVSPVQAAREKLRRAVDREQEIREGQVDLQLGIEGAAEDLAALQQKRDMLMRKLFHSEAFDPQELAATKAALAETDAEARAKREMLAQRDELLEIAVEEIQRARAELEAVLRKEVAAADQRVVARMAEYARVRDDAANRHTELLNASTDAGQLLRGAFGGRAEVRDLEAMLERMESVL